MKKIKYSILLGALALGFALLAASSCASTTIISSNPEGAKVYLDNEYVGLTPYSYTDTKIMGSQTSIRLEKEGYSPFLTTLSKTEEANVEAIVGGIFLIVPYLWTMGYKANHFYEMSPEN
ncbi:MAG: PEGA domain-containing protein [Bacteroidales bacterium]|jgi:hypothetical protein|nr:PEGA domain-containing protein [Bacteroidales bacterium]MCI2121309.1 PEGA domain-containing protein [Bacteroidales bacterium]MCI2145201.1 PEGA domain-containing protein [Bacteroidales bacterium]